MLKFSSMSPELEHLNELGYRLPLNDLEIKRMQNLNRSWSAASTQTTERFRYVCSILLTFCIIFSKENLTKENIVILNKRGMKKKITLIVLYL